MLFREYQARAHETATTADLDVYSLGLIGEAGSVASAIKKYKRDHPAEPQIKRDIGEELGDVLWYLAELATRFGIDLDEVAAGNLKKTDFLFKGRATHLDGGFPAEEQFPRHITIQFVDDGSKLELFANGVCVGDPLTDNAYEDDGYRYHDAFHIAYMTTLGWSPVMRSILRCKRKSDLAVDQVEDGARARALEEGISIMVFSQSQPAANGQSLFSDRSQIPFWLLETIKKMTPTLEVSVKNVSDWRRAIASGYEVFDQLRRHRGGYVDCNLVTRTLAYRAP